MNRCGCVPNKVIKTTSSNLRFFFFWFLFGIHNRISQCNRLGIIIISKVPPLYHMASYMKSQFNYVLPNHWFGFHNKFVNSSEQLVNNEIILWFSWSRSSSDGDSNICKSKSFIDQFRRYILSPSIFLSISLYPEWLLFCFVTCLICSYYFGFLNWKMW